MVMFLNCLVIRLKRLTSCSGLRTHSCSLVRMIELSITMTGSDGLLLFFLVMSYVMQPLPVPRLVPRTPLLLRLNQMKQFEILAIAVLCLIEILLLFVLFGVITH